MLFVVDRYEGSQRFLGAPLAYSGLTRAGIPAASGHRFRNDAGAKSGRTRALIPA
jgi:hypothetical protein